MFAKFGLGVRTEASVVKQLVYWGLIGCLVFSTLGSLVSNSLAGGPGIQHPGGMASSTLWGRVALLRLC